MHGTNLHIFSKNTDATASLRGYHYQVLKTIETWVDNFNEGIDDEIYCDFEEDIFQKNQLSKTAKFRQIKLYSSNFSFASEEIQKCLAHFFMLHVKTNYSSLDKEFVFEANTSIAQKKGTNDSDLLKEWNEKQDNPDEEFLDRCAEKVKSIISNYIDIQAKALSGKQEEGVIRDALKVFESLDKDDWVDFAKRVKWKFNNTSAEIEFKLLKEKIENILQLLPFPIDERNLATTFGLIHTTVWNKASVQNPEERKLTLDELKEILLQTATDNDIWYWQIYGKWEGVISIANFIIGEFFETIDATRHCRQHAFLQKHDKLWLNILKNYIEEVSITDEFKRIAIYEFLWLRFRLTDIYSKPSGDLIGTSEYFYLYFHDINADRNALELENAQSLMNIALAACYLGLIDLEIDQVRTWFQQCEKILQEKLKSETNPNEICHLLENLSTHYLFLNARERETKNIEVVIAPLEKIFAEIDDADLYNVTTLCNRLNSFINLLIAVDPEANSELIDALENVSNRLNPIVEKRHGSYMVAKVEVKKGTQYLRSDNPVLILKALNCFHKAKTLWYNQEHIEGFVLALINIAQLYSGLGLNLAAKYYALSAAWASIHNTSKHLLKRIADSFGLIFYADFKQGAWMNAIISFADYMNARHEFKNTPLDPEIDEMPFKTLADLALVLYATPKISPQLKVLVDSHIEMLGQLGEEFVKPLFPQLEIDYPTRDSLIPLLERKLSDRPLNDLGKYRKVNFHALGSNWEVTFVNDYLTNPIAEEFCGLMQVMLAEIALSKIDYHLLKSTIKIELEVNPDFLPPEQLPSHTELKWKVFIEFFNSKIPAEINLHTARSSVALSYILDEISLLPHDEFSKLFETLFKDYDLAGKTLILGAYQRMYRYVFKQPRFDSLHRQSFESVNEFELDLPQGYNAMEWNNRLSIKYNQQVAIRRISERFRNSLKCIYITINKLKKDKDFLALINDLRMKGWLDWQIILSIMNFMLNYKTQRSLSKYSFKTEEQYREAYDKLFTKLLNTDEKDYFVEFPVEAFLSQEFNMQINHTLIVVLGSYGLENKARYPNYSSVKEFLDVRFNMRYDNTDEGNPIIDI